MSRACQSTCTRLIFPRAFCLTTCTQTRFLLTYFFSSSTKTYLLIKTCIPILRVAWEPAFDCMTLLESCARMCLVSPETANDGARVMYRLSKNPNGNLRARKFPFGFFSSRYMTLTASFPDSGEPRPIRAHNSLRTIQTYSTCKIRFDLGRSRQQGRMTSSDDPTHLSADALRSVGSSTT